MNNTAKAIQAEIVEFPNQETLTDRQLNNRIEKLIQLEAESKRIKKEIDAIKAEIKEAFAGTRETNKYIVTNTVYSRTTVDSKRLKADFPEVYEEYSKTSECNKLTYKEV